MQNLLNDLTDLLKQDERLVVDGHLLKNQIVEMALKIDASLIKLLMTHEDIRRHFFTDIGGVIVFDKIKFQQFVMNKQFLPDSYTAYKNKIGLTVNGQYLTDSKEVVLAWPYKDCVLEGGQDKEDAKRDEIFWNETLAPDQIDRLLAPKALTGFKKFDKEGEHKVTSISRNDNLIIKGNNLLALHTLKTNYSGKIKLIYIDPPYNTGGDSFKYNDNFNHSTWLTFMRSRLEAAKPLLRKDGVIVIHCDYIEDAYTKVLCDEIFGTRNYINTIAVRDSHPSGLKLSAKDQKIIKTKSAMLIYKKDETLKITPIYQKREEWDTHFNTFVDTSDVTLKKTPLSEYVKNKFNWTNFKLNKDALKHQGFREFAFQNRNQIFQSTKEIPKDAKEESLKSKNKVIEYKKGEYALNGRRLSPLSKSIHSIGFDGYEYEDFAKLLCDFWDDMDFNNSQNEGGISFPAGKKPELLLARIITMFSKSGDTVLDFHLGSGTTCAVAQKMERHWIGIEQLDYEEDDSVIRLKAVVNGDSTGISKLNNWQGGGSFIYCELSKANQIFFDRIEVAKTATELQKIWEEMQQRAFLSYHIDPKKIDLHSKDFASLSLDDQKRFLREILDKNMLYVPYSEIDDETYRISDDDKKLNRQFHEDVGK